MKADELLKETGWRHERERLKVDRNSQLREIQNALDGNVDWHVAIKLIKEIMDANDIILGDLE